MALEQAQDVTVEAGRVHPVRARMDADLIGDTAGAAEGTDDVALRALPPPGTNHRKRALMGLEDLPGPARLTSGLLTLLPCSKSNHRRVALRCKESVKCNR